MLGIARRSAVDARIETLNQLRHVVFGATPEIRSKFGGLTAISLANKAAVLRPRGGDDPVRYTTQVTIRTLGQRVKYLREEVKRLNRLIRPLIRETAPGLLEVFGVGFDTAAKLLVAAGDNPERIRSEAAFAHLCGVAPIPASSGKTARHRLNRGGNRQANSALFHIVLTRMKHDQATRDSIARRLAEGNTMGEIARILKRYAAREVFKHRPRPAYESPWESWRLRSLEARMELWIIRVMGRDVDIRLSSGSVRCGWCISSARRRVRMSGRSSGLPASWVAGSSRFGRGLNGTRSTVANDRG